MNVLIPSAKIVPEELQNLGKLPAIIYPVGQGSTLDYLLEQYEGKADILRILCYEMADEVERRLSSFRSEKIRFQRLERLGDLGETIYAGLEETHAPVVINFADTIVMDRMPEGTLDGFFCAEDYPSDIWTFFECEDGIITSILDKQKSFGDGNRRKLFVGVFLISDQADLKNCLERSFQKRNPQMNTFYQALMQYSQIHPMQAVYTDNWFVIGHADKYYNSKLEVQAREFNHITIDKNRGILSKSSDDKEKLIGEIMWYLKLPEDIEYVRPRIFSYSTRFQAPYISMEYYSYHTVHELFLYGDLNYHQWRDIFERIRFIYRDFKRYSVCDGGTVRALKEVYLDKTLERMDRLRADNRFQNFFRMPVKVNGVLYLPLGEICRKLSEEIPQRLYDVEMFHIIHGDLCFSNIMIDSNFSFIKVIDPRGRFGAYDIYGDQRYELAKLFHSVDGRYDFIIKNLFELKVDAEHAELNYRIMDRKREFDLYKMFCSVFREEIGGDQEKIVLIEALLFLSMIPLHNENLEHQYAMLATGVELLHRVMDIRTEENGGNEYVS